MAGYTVVVPALEKSRVRLCAGFSIRGAHQMPSIPRGHSYHEWHAAFAAKVVNFGSCMIQPEPLKRCITTKDKFLPEPFTHPPNPTKIHQKTWAISCTVTLPKLSFSYDVWKNCRLHSTSFTVTSYAPQLCYSRTFSLQGCCILPSHLRAKAPLSPSPKGTLFYKVP